MMPSITACRGRIGTLLHNESARRAPRDLVILAVDGITYALAASLWTGARVEAMASVFPTTSSAAWLSSLTGLPVSAHGVPGVVFRDDSGELINIFSHPVRLPGPDAGNLFSDASACGYQPLAALGDLAGLPEAWLATLLDGAELVATPPLYATMAPRNPQQIADALLQTVTACRARRREGKPILAWCFIDSDRHIHRHGYDAALLGMLAALDGMARHLAGAGRALVLAHSDHGLVDTAHDPAIATLFAHLERRFGSSMGGAGRTRWIYPRAGTSAALAAHLRRALPATVHLCDADQLFDPGSLARSRVGELVLIARGPVFATFDGHRFDHGGDSDAERHVPFATWHGEDRPDAR